MSQRLAGKVAVITGGSIGIGLATAKRFVDEGAYVFVTGRRKNELDAAVKEIGRNVTGVQGDASKLADIDTLYAVVKEQKGKLDIVFAKAFSVYSATKAAERSFARTWCVDLKDRKIRVNAISPGVVPTPGYNTSLGMTQEQVDQFVQSSISGIPLGRPGTTDEIAKAALFLASDDSSYVNGIELFVDGGLAQI
jgi:NAD(P)-dependent dehydrogenase (short-subunit alcohol dehydrogenase family)